MPHRTHSTTADVASLLTSRRDQLGLSQDVIATRAGATQAGVSRLERGLSDPQLSTIIDVTRALELELRFVPREALPAVDALLRTLANPESATDVDRPLYALDVDDEPDPVTPAEIA